MSDYLGTRAIQQSIDGRYTASITRQILDTEEELLLLVNANRRYVFTTIWTNDLSRAHRVAAILDVCIEHQELKHG